MLRLRHFIYLVLMLTLAFCRAHGQDIYDCYTGSSEQGGHKLTVNGIQSAQFAQQSYPAATVTVFVHATVTHATIFQDAAGTLPIAGGTFTTTSNGIGFWCAADGHYDVQYSGTGITTPFTISDIHLCFACSGGGGGAVGPGTINQVAKFTATNNVGNSSGGPDDGSHAVPWVNGLSVEQSDLEISCVNGAAGTTANLLVEPDASTNCQTASISSIKVPGVAITGAGTTGSSRVAIAGYANCVFDGTTVVGD